MGWLPLKDFGRIGGYEVCRAVVVMVVILVVGEQKQGRLKVGEES